MNYEKKIDWSFSVDLRNWYVGVGSSKLETFRAEDPEDADPFWISKTLTFSLLCFKLVRYESRFSRN